MELTATHFRRNLFQVLDSALRGESVDITYKGGKIRLTAPQGADRLSRAVRRNALLLDPDLIVESDPQLMSEFETAWSKEDSEL